MLLDGFCDFSLFMIIWVCSLCLKECILIGLLGDFLCLVPVLYDLMRLHDFSRSIEIFLNTFKIR